MSLFLKIALLLLCTHPVLPQNIKFSKFRKRMEAKASKISSTIQQLYKQRCTSEMQSCPTKSYNACKGCAEKSCDYEYPKPDQCFISGSYVSKESAINFPENIDYDSLKEEEKCFICLSALLQDTFKQISQNRNQQFTYSYFGSKEGLFRFFPGNYFEEECHTYDPRYRPWYTIASSGAKNILLLLDTSQNMDYKELEILKNSAKSICRTLSNVNSLGVMTMGETINSLGQRLLQQVTEGSVDDLTEKLSHIVAKGKYNFTEALMEGMQVIKESHEDGTAFLSCFEGESIVMIFTDGESTRGLEIEETLSLIEEYDEFKKVFIFIIVGEDPYLEKIHDLLCRLPGIMIQLTQLSSQSQVYTDMIQVHNLLSSTIVEAEPIWTEPYIDYFGYGEMVTVSMPAYYTYPHNNVTVLLGVSGVDILMSQFEKFNYESSELIHFLLGETLCFRYQITYCERDQFLEETVKCNPDCQPENSEQVCTSYSYSSEIFTPVDTQDVSLCCGLLTIEFIAIIIGSLFFFFTVVFCYIKRKSITNFCSLLKKRRAEKREKEGKEKQGNDGSHSRAHSLPTQSHINKSCGLVE